MTYYPPVMPARFSGRCCHCNLPIEVGDPITDYLYCGTGSWVGWEHADHHPRSYEAAVAWGLIAEEAGLKDADDQ